MKKTRRMRRRVRRRLHSPSSHPLDDVIVRVPKPRHRSAKTEGRESSQFKDQVTSVGAEIRAMKQAYGASVVKYDADSRAIILKRIEQSISVDSHAASIPASVVPLGEVHSFQGLSRERGEHHHGVRRLSPCAST